MSDQMDPRLRHAMRHALVAHVEASTTTARGWWRRWPAAVGVGVLLLGGGAAVAVDLLLPGADRVTALGYEVTMVGAGDGTVELGPAPSGATHIEVSFECLTPGVFLLDRSSGSVTCSARSSGAGLGATSAYSVPLSAGRSSTTVSAPPGARWRVTAHYATREMTTWAINDRGETYGLAKQDGTEPDLVAVSIGDTGLVGYVYAEDLDPPSPSSPADALATNDVPPLPVPVYEPDGWSIIGVFTTHGRLLEPGEPPPHRPPWTATASERP